MAPPLGTLPQLHHLPKVYLPTTNYLTAKSSFFGLPTSPSPGGLQSANLSARTTAHHGAASGSCQNARQVGNARLLRDAPHPNHRRAHHSLSVGSVSVSAAGWLLTEGHHRLRDDDLAYLMATNTKDLHKACGKLREDRFLAVYARNLPLVVSG